MKKDDIKLFNFQVWSIICLFAGVLVREIKPRDPLLEVVWISAMLIALISTPIFFWVFK